MFVYVKNMFHYGIIFFAMNLGSFFILTNCYVLPEPTFEMLEPRGIRVTIPDAPKLQFFAFHGNKNKAIKPNEVGDISGEIYRKKDGKWSIQNQHVLLADGDVVHYWISVQADGTMHKSEERTWTVSFQMQTVQSLEKRIPGGVLLFDENFNSLNNSIWERVVKIPLRPDYEFCVYHNEQHTILVQISNGTLRIKPVILEDLYGESVAGFGTLLLSGCTSTIPEECTRKVVNFNILPPVISARLSTKTSFSFRYGKIEIRAKFPEGDWLYPELWLEPKYHNYGFEYESGRILLGLTRGNDHLVNTTTGTIFDSRRLDYGIRVGTITDVQEYMVSKVQENGPRWTKDFHVYTTIWNSDGFQFLVDDEEVGNLRPETNGWMGSSSSSKVAPFDQEFYITIGVGIGGIRVFPDGTISSGHTKPWRNVGAKAMLKFWQRRDWWLPSWTQGNAVKNVFEIDYIRVWSL